MDSNAIELLDEDKNDEFMMGSAGDTYESEMKKKKMKKIIIVIIFFVILLSIILCLVLFLSPSTDTECKIGQNENCLSCEKGTKKCGSCNPNFRLENGKCLFIFSFEAIYSIVQRDEDINYLM